MARTVKTPDAGRYNSPALIQKPVDRAAGEYTTVRGGTSNPLMVNLQSAGLGRKRQSLAIWARDYPQATDFAEMRYSKTAIDSSMVLTAGGEIYQILGVTDPEFRHDVLVLALAPIDAESLGLNKTCVIKRRLTPTKSYGSQGGPYTTISEDGLMAGLAPPTASQLQAYHDRIGSLVLYRVKLPIGTDAQIQDQLVIDGQEMTVQGLEQPQPYPVLIFVLATGVS